MGVALEVAMASNAITQLPASDHVTRRVQDQYSRFPYPSAEAGEQRLTELANLLRLFAAETPYDFRGKTVLDVGTGTGHRLIAAARRFPETRFVAVDLAGPPLEIARATAENASVTNVTFLQRDVFGENADLGTFDVVLCMGVLHHLADPAAGLQRLTERVADDGVLFAYVYGALGSAERLRRKEMLSLMTGPNAPFEAGIRMAREMGFDAGNFGWTLNADDARSRDALIVDSYLNVNETLFDIGGIGDLMETSGLDAFMVYGITTESRGLLLDADVDAGVAHLAQWTDMTKVLRAPLALDAYRRLSLPERYRMIELTHQPNGYTVLGYRQAGAQRFAPNSRVYRNTLAARDSQP
ncbi:MAG TPA: class I SAM-dependent methyltransferase [Gemmatimonadaceae bacterium]